MPTSTFAQPRDNAALRIHTGQHVHLVGIAGSGMRSLADVLFGAGYSVSGSDLQAHTLVGSRYNVRLGHWADTIDNTVDLVVHSAAVPHDNPELTRARELEVPTLSYPRMLGQLMESRIGVAIAGTHGKSTTTAMAGEILSAAGMDPTIVYGAAPLESRAASRFGHGRLMLAEACEYRANFRHLKPQVAVLLGIELDHVDYFGSLAAVETAFADFARRVPAEGLVLARADCAATRRAIAGLDCSVESFGPAPATWHASAVRERRGYYSFQLRCRQRLVCDVKMSVPGRHNLQNALAAAALASHHGATGKAIRAGLERFAGLRRRLELVADDGPVAVLDDYAHHPTEVTAALTTVRQMYPQRRVWCVFQPHQASRTGRLLDEFARSLQNADKIVVADIVRAREESRGPGEVTAADLVDRVARLGSDARHLPTPNDIVRYLQRSLQAGDVLVTLGAGDIGTIAHELRQGFRTIRKAG